MFSGDFSNEIGKICLTHGKPTEEVNLARNKVYLDRSANITWLVGSKCGYESWIGITPELVSCNFCHDDVRIVILHDMKCKDTECLCYNETKGQFKMGDLW